MTRFTPNPEEIRALINLADQNLKMAKLELEHNFIRGAIAKAYYVFLDMARAALISKGLITKTHGSAVGKFAETFIKTGLISKEFGRWFNRALRARQEADYEALKDFTKEEAEELVVQSEKFFQEVKKVIKI